MICWLLEVVYDPHEGRSPRYFTGYVTPGWQGCTTLDPHQAVQYPNEFMAVKDMKKLAPRELGRWQPVEHLFMDAA